MTKSQPGQAWARCLGTGPARAIEGVGKNRRLQTSTLFGFGDTRILIDVTPSISQQIYWIEEGVPEHSDLHIFITHPHSDACWGIPAFLKVAKNRWNITWHAHPDLIAKRIVPKTAIPLSDQKPVQVESVSLTPFLVPHVKDPNRRVPNFGFFLSANDLQITYVTDLLKLTPTAEQFMKKSGVIFIDGSGWDHPVINHHAVVDFLHHSKNWNTEVIVTHIGRNVPKSGAGEQEAQQIRPKTRFAYDGMKVVFERTGIRIS